MSKLKPAENPNYTGNLTINVTSSIGLIPINNATITISLKSTPQSPILTLTTDNSGQTKTIQLPAPNFSYSQEPGDIQPYTEYNIDVSAPGYETVRVSGTEILPDVNAIQPITMNPLNLAEQNPITSTPEIPSEGEVENILIPDHTLYGDYPAKIPEAEIKPIDESGEIVLSRVVIPEYVIVHDGLPSDSSAPNYYVRYTDYIKNVVSSEIYATWPESTIYANTLAIMSFTLNRVYTEW